MLFNMNKDSRLKVTLILLLQIMIIVFLIVACSGVQEEKSIPVANQKVNQEDNTKTLDPDINISKHANDILEKMTIDEKIHQMLFVTPEVLTGIGQVVQAGETTKQSLYTHPVGGIIYFNENIVDKEQVQTMITQTQSFAKIPLFIGVDEEGGRVSRISKDFFIPIEPMAHIGASGDASKALETGKIIAANIKSMGFNVTFAPVADVLTDPNNMAIGDRSFGKDPYIVADMVKQEVIGLQTNGVSAAIKHFPGHGGTTTDTHQGYTESFRTVDDLRSIDFLPFKAGIDTGVDFVMLSHISSTQADNSGLPASLSKIMVTDYLKNELNFKKIIITDSMSMGAILNNYSSGEAAVLAIQAGVDMLLCPSDIDETVQGIKNALKKGELSEKQINDSVAKILKVKIDRGIIE